MSMLCGKCLQPFEAGHICGSPEIEIGSLRPRARFLWHGYKMEVERQARRTTFARVISGPLSDARIQVKRATKVYA